MSELVDGRRLSRDDTLGDIDRASDGRLSARCVLNGLADDLDDDDAGVVGSAIVLAISEIAHPRLQRGRVILLYPLTVGLNGRFAGHGSPLAAGVEESEVDFGVGVEIVGLAGFRVGVEDKVNTIALL